MSPSFRVGRIDPPLTRTANQPNTMDVSIGLSSAESTLAERLAQRDPVAWRARGRLALFAIGMALALGAVITFVAHNWTYLNTVAKLGVIAALLVASAVVWMARRFKGRVAEVAGIGAQILIGVWLAAAGQLYQAPGDVGDLLFRWALLGLPFALASRSRAHWAVWALVAAGAFASGGSWMPDGVSGHWRGVLGAVVMGVGYLVAGVTLRGWLATLFGTLAAAFLVVSGVWALFGEESWLAFALCLLGGGLLFALGVLRRQSLAVPSVAAAAAIGLVVALIWHAVLARIGFDTLAALMATLVFGGATAALLRVFGWLRVRSGRESGSPWYMDALSAIGGVLTAVFGALFIFALLGVVLAAASAVEIGALIIGLGLYAGGLALRLRGGGLFRRYLATTVMLIGGAAAITGMALLAGEDGIAMVGAGLIALAAFPFIRIPERTIETILALVIGLGVATITVDMLGIDSGRVGSWFGPIVFAVLGSFSLVALIQLKPMKVASLPVWAVVSGAFLLALGVGQWETRSRFADWAASWPSLVVVAFVLFGLLASAKATVLRRELPGWPALAVLSVLAALLPAGAAPVILVLLLGYAIGSTTLFLLGGIGTAIYLYAAFFDMSLTLLEMACAMAVSAAVVLGLWGLSRAREGSA